MSVQVRELVFVLLQRLLLAERLGPKYVPEHGAGVWEGQSSSAV